MQRILLSNRTYLYIGPANIKMDLESNLRNEIAKWTLRINEEMKTVKETKNNKKYLTNINAYIDDSKFFLEKEDLIRSFEALIWAWAHLEILEDLKKI